MADDLERKYTGAMSPATIAWLERRSEAFAVATSRPKGKPKDGVSYPKASARRP